MLMDPRSTSTNARKAAFLSNRTMNASGTILRGRERHSNSSAAPASLAHSLSPKPAVALSSAT